MPIFVKVEIRGDGIKTTSQTKRKQLLFTHQILRVTSI